MKWCLINSLYINFNAIPFVSEEYSDFDPDTYDLPLWFAYMNYRSDIVLLMLQRGYNPNEIENFYQKRILLHLAAFRHDKYMCKLLIFYGANIHFHNCIGESPVDHAGPTKDMLPETRLELLHKFPNNRIKMFQKFMINLYFQRIR